MLRLALIFGGRSAEHEISLASARFVHSMLDRDKYDVVPVGITPAGRWVVPDGLRRRDHRRPRRRRLADRAPGLGPDAPGSRARRRVVPPARLRLPHHARHLRRGRHHPGPPRDGRAGLRRVRRAGQLRRHGQGAHEGRVRERGPAADGLRGAARRRGRRPGRRGRRRGAARVSGVRQAGQPRLQRGHDQGPRPGRAGAGAGAGRRLRSQDDRRGGLRRPRARVQPCSATTASARRSSARSSRATSSTTTSRSTPRARWPSRSLPASTSGTASACASSRSPRSSVIDASGFSRCDFFLEAATDRVILNEINTIPGMTAMSGFPRLWAASGVDGRALVERDRAAGTRAPRAARPAQDGALAPLSPRPRPRSFYSALPVRVGCVVRSTQSLSGGIFPR